MPFLLTAVTYSQWPHLPLPAVHMTGIPPAPQEESGVMEEEEEENHST